MSRSPYSDDPKLTAFVLEKAELDPETAEAVEREIAGSESLRREVEDIRSTARLLAAALTSEPSPSLTEEQRRSVEEAAASASRARRRPGRTVAAWAGLAAAAVLLGLAVPWPDRQPRKDR